MKRYLCLALLMLAAASAVASEIALDLRPRAVRTRGVAAPRATQTEEEAGTLRQTVLDAGAASTGSLAVGDVLRLSVYDDVTLSLTLVAREEAPLARASFQAEVSGANWRDAVVTETDAGLLVTATDPASGLVYAVVSSDDRVTVREIDPHALPVVDGGVRVPELDAVRDGVPTKRSAASTDQASTVVDMLVAYDRPAAAWAKANGGGVTNLAQQCVARMNGALANNGLDAAFRFRLVGVMAVDADGDGNLNDTLDKVTQKTGAWAVVSAMRDAVGADVVSTMVDTGSAYGTTGLGWSLTQTTASGMRNFSEHAYNVLSVRAAAQSHVMAHETRHNMGAGHANARLSLHVAAHADEDHDDSGGDRDGRHDRPRLRGDLLQVGSRRRAQRPAARLEHVRRLSVDGTGDKYIRRNAGRAVRRAPQGNREPDLAFHDRHGADEDEFPLPGQDVVECFPGLSRFVCRLADGRCSGRLDARGGGRPDRRPCGEVRV